MENKTENVSEEIQEEANVQATEAQAPETVQTPETQETQSQSDKEYNFNELRKSKQQLEEENRELKDYLKKMETSQQASPAPAPQEYELGDEDLAEGKHLKKINQNVNNLQNELKANRLRMKFPDIEEVVSEKNMEKLKTSEPELYASITSGSDLYVSGVSAYKAITKLGIISENYTSQKDQIQSNHNRPLSTQAIKGQGALSEKNVFAAGLTPQLRKQLQEEMAEAAKAH